MSQVLCIECGTLAQDLHGFLQSIDPARWRHEMEQATRERCRHIRWELHRILESHAALREDRRMARLNEGLQAVATLLEQRRPREGASTQRLRQEWAALQKQLKPAYAALAASLEHLSVPVPSLRPANHARSVFHVCCGVFSLALIQYVLSPWGLMAVAISAALAAWTLETLRVRNPRVTDFCMIFLGKFAHPHEWHRVNSSTWYTTALALLAIYATPLTASVAVVVLAVGDPIAALVGRRFGRVKLRSGRTLEGTLAFVTTGTLLAFVMLLVYYPSLGAGLSFLTAICATLMGALAELFSKRLDDNLTIPLAAALGATLVLTYLA